MYRKHLLSNSHLVKSFRLSLTIISIVFVVQVCFGNLSYFFLFCRPGSEVTSSFSRHHVSAVVSIYKTDCLRPGGTSEPSRPSMILAGSESAQPTRVIIPMEQGMNKFSACVSTTLLVLKDFWNHEWHLMHPNDPKTSIVRVGHDQQIRCTQICQQDTCM